MVTQLGFDIYTNLATDFTLLSNLSTISKAMHISKFEEFEVFSSVLPYRCFIYYKEISHDLTIMVSNEASIPNSACTIMKILKYILFKKSVDN